MVAIISLIVVLLLSLLITRIATLALTLTGLSRQTARFQARSAFTGVGFTTSESERAVNHPVRRRILMLLMLLGNAGVVTVISTLILGLVDQGDHTSLALRLGILMGGLALLLTLSTSGWVDRRLSRIIAWALNRWTTLEVRDYAALLHLGGDYLISELRVRPDDWLAGSSLEKLRLNDEGVLVLGIERLGGNFVGAPRGEAVINAGDTLLLYARSGSVAALDQRGKGHEGLAAHKEAVHEQARRQADEEATDQSGRHGSNQPD